MKRLLLILIPMLLLLLLFGTQNVKGAILTADVRVDFPGGVYAPLEVGELVSFEYERYYWYEVPTFAEEDKFLFWQWEKTGYPSIADGVATFEVLTDGPVLLACRTPWGGLGNPSGGWKEEQISYEDFLEDGWSEFATGLSQAHISYPPPNAEYIVYRRDSFAGEVFTYRVEKYGPPIVIRSEAVIPEPSTFIIWSLLGLTVAGGAWWRVGSKRGR